MRPLNGGRSVYTKLRSAVKNRVTWTNWEELQFELQRFMAEELRSPRYLEPKRVTQCGYKVYSQADEDGIIAEIFRRIGAPAQTFVEFGVETGSECNSLWLLAQGWSGLWIEADRNFCTKIRTNLRSYMDKDSGLHLINDFVTAKNINDLIGSRYKNDELDFLSIDIDHNDYWVWKEINVVRPRVVCIEYNSAWRPPARLSVPYDPRGTWDQTNYMGSSLSALTELGKTKGYSLVACSMSGSNAFFVRDDLVGDYFHAPGSDVEHYEPPRYFLRHLKGGHPAGFGPLVILKPGG